MKPKTSSKGRDKKQTYSIEDFDRVDLFCSPLRVQQWAPLEKLMEDKSLRKKPEKKEVRGFEK